MSPPKPFGRFSERERNREERHIPEGRIPPNALDAERAVLGGVLLDNEGLDIVTEILGSDDFYSEANAQIYECMREIFARGEPIDTITLRAELVKHGRLAAVGGDEYLIELTNKIPMVANIATHAKIVRDKARLRRLILVCHEIAADGYGHVSDADAFVDAAEGRVYEAVRQDDPGEGLVRIREDVVTVVKKLEALRDGGEITGLTTGFDRLDRMLGGMQPGDLILVAGRPGMGKTAFGVGIGDHVASKHGPVAVFELEMTREQLIKRQLASRGRIDGNRMKTGQFSEQDWPKLVAAAEDLYKLPLSVDETAGLSIATIRARSRRAKKRDDIVLIVVDYVQLARGVAHAENREQEIGSIAQGLKNLAKELRIPIIALSQLNRDVEKRADRRPVLSDLRESGALEQEADTIMFIYRDEVYHRDTDDRGIAEIIVGKQRSGATGTVRCRFFPEYTRFDNLEEIEDAEFSDDPARLAPPSTLEARALAAQEKKRQAEQQELVPKGDAAE